MCLILQHHLLQHACRENDYTQFKTFSNAIHEQRNDHLRDLLEFKAQQSIHISEVESVESIVKRFNTGAMSYGSISEEAHQTLAQAMNKIGGKSNSGEGGENPKRYEIQEDGTVLSSAIKQVASGRFGVTSNYLQHAKNYKLKLLKVLSREKEDSYRAQKYILGLLKHEVQRQVSD